MPGNRKKSLDQNRIALMIPTLEGGGAEKNYLNLAEGFANSGFQVDLIVKQATGEYLSQVPRSINLIDLNVPRMARTLPGIIRYLQTQRPRALLAGLDLPNLICVMAQIASGVPTKVIVSIHTVVSQGEHFFLPNRSLERVTMKLLYPRACEIVVVSSDAAADFSDFVGIPLSRVRVIYNPIITQEFRKKAQHPLEHPWLAPGQPPVILGVGRLERVKDFPTLIRAFARMRQHTPARLLILGEGEQREELESLVKQLGLQADICLPGFQQNPYPFMRQAALLVLSSLHEAAPSVIIEALACGCPVIATDSPGGSGELTGYGKYGHLVPVGDDVALAEAFQQVLDGDVRKPPAEWLHQYESERVIQKYLELI